MQDILEEEKPTDSEDIWPSLIRTQNMHGIKYKKISFQLEIKLISKMLSISLHCSQNDFFYGWNLRTLQSMGDRINSQFSAKLNDKDSSTISKLFERITGSKE